MLSKTAPCVNLTVGDIADSIDPRLGSLLTAYLRSKTVKSRKDGEVIYKSQIDWALGECRDEINRLLTPEKLIKVEIDSMPEDYRGHIKPPPALEELIQKKLFLEKLADALLAFE